MKNANNFLYNLVSLLLCLALSLFFTNAVGGGPFMAVGIALVPFAISFAAPYYLPRGAFFMALNAKAITKNANPKNIGGLADTHYYAFIEDILSFPPGMDIDPTTATDFDELIVLPETDLFVFRTGKCFMPFPAILEEGQIKSTRVGPTGSNAYEITADLAEQGNNNVLAGMLAFSANKRGVIYLIKELNGTVKVVGTELYPAQLATHELNNAGKASDGNTQKYQVKSAREYPAPTYTAPIPLTPAV